MGGENSMQKTRFQYKILFIKVKILAVLEFIQTNQVKNLKYEFYTQNKIIDGGKFQE